MLPLIIISTAVNVFSDQNHPDVYHFLFAYSFKQKRIRTPMQTASGSRAPRINDVQHGALHVKQGDPRNGASTVLGCRCKSCTLSSTVLPQEEFLSSWVSVILARTPGLSVERSENLQSIHFDKGILLF